MSHRSANSRKLWLASTSALSFLITVPAFAQQASSSSDLQEVVVTGFRQSLQNALDNKRQSDLPIESVAPEDIGKMPDQNVAEALQRLPGIQIGRDSSGVGTQVLIDGLRQNLTTLNGDVFLTGKEFYVSGENSGGGAGAGAQYASLEGIPSEEIGGIDVYKNPKASITEGGLGGTIDLKTRDPLAQPLGYSVGGNFRMTTSENQGDWTPNGTVVGSYNFNNKLAITASFSYDDEKSKTQEFEDANRSGWIITNSSTPPYTGTLTPAGIGNLGKYYIDPQLAYFSDIEEDRKVYGASLGVAAKLSDSIKTHVNWFYSHEDDVSLDYSDKVGFNGSGQPAGALIPGIDPTQPYSVDANGVVQNGTFASTGAETATLYQHSISESNNVQWLTEYNSGGQWRGDVDASYAFSTSNYQAAQADIEHGYYTAFTGAPTTPTAPGCNNFAPTCAAGSGNHGYVFSWTNGGTSGLPTVNYPTNVLTNLNYVLFKSNWAWANLTSQQQFALKGDLEYDPNFIKGVDTTLTAGVRYGSRHVGQTFGRYLIDGVDSTGKALANCCQDPNGSTWLYYSDPGYANIPFSTALSNPGLVKTVNIKGVGPVVVKDPSAGGLTNPSTYLNTVWNGAGVANNSEKFFADGLSSFSVQEHTYAAYLMGDMGNQSNRFHVNYGVRFVQTDLNINNGQSAAVPTYWGTASWNGVDSNVVPVTTNRSYSDVLPSLNFVLDASDTEKIRFGAARVVSPQDLFALGAGNLYNFSRETNGRTNIHTGVKDGFAFFGGTSGNTQLDPYRASQALLSYENYFSRSGLLQIGGFYKQVDNFVETQNVPTFVMDDFGGSTNNVSKPVNAGKGQIYGAEIGGQYSFDDKWAKWMDGFGVAANYTRSMSVSEQPTSFQSQGPIPGIAKNALTTTLYYEKNGFSARASYSWQDVSVSNGGFGSTFAFNDQNGVSKTYTVFQAPYGELDGQVSYDINEHFGVVFSVQNLTDAAEHTYLQWKNLPFTYDDVGRRFFLGGKFKL
jgi:iron complex outermembrane receptor protein